MSYEPIYIPTRKQRWGWKFYLALATLVMIAFVALVWWYLYYLPVMRQANAVQRLEAAGARIRYDWQLQEDGPSRIPGSRDARSLLGDDFFQRVAAIDFTQPKPITESLWSDLESCRELRWLALVGCKVDDQQALHLQNYPNLETLILDHNPLGDDACETIATLKHLQTLQLSTTKVSDTGLSHLDQLENLVALSLDQTQITDEGIKSLAELSMLRELYLNDTAISDSCIETFTSLQNLETLHISGTDITDSGYQLIQQALPDVGIVK